MQILFQEEILNKQVNVQREVYSESELTLKVTIDRENSEVSQVPKKGGGGTHCIHSAFNINQALKLGRSQTCHISDLSVSKRTLIYAREKNTPQSTMMLLNCVDCMVSEYLPLPKFKSLIILLV